MPRRQRTREFLALRRYITRVLNEEDPIGLIGLGAPADEYDPEVGTIMLRLKEATSIAVLRRIIYEEFVSWFGVAVAGPEEGYHRAAERIWPVLSEPPGG